MRRAVHTDREGQRWAVLLPDGVPDTDVALGIVIGPPDTAPLGLSRDATVRLHNALFDRDLLTEADARRRPGDVLNAIRVALRLDAERVIALYAEGVILGAEDTDQQQRESPP